MLVMALRAKDRHSCIAKAAIASLAAFLAIPTPLHADSKRKPDPGPPPAARIPVEPLGFTPPSKFYLVYRLSSTTLDFIDNNHLLFTFRSGQLLTRLPGDPPDDEDQLIHAEVIDISSGKRLQEADWRMHDRQRYLWPLGGGQFLVRQRNSLFLTDRRLELRPYLTFENALQAVELAPDRKLLMLELQERVPPDSDSEAVPDPQQPAIPGSLPDIKAIHPRSRVEVMMLHPGESSVIARSETRHAVDLPLLADGFLQMLEGKEPNQWVVEKISFRGEPQIIATIKSYCMPTLMTLSSDVALAIGCSANGGDHAVSAISLQGTILWQDRWQQRYIWPTFDYSQDGSRFAYGSLEVAHDLGMADPFGDGDVVAQMVGVFDTETGKLELVKDATPILSSGQNYALSADGKRFAILRDGAIEVYDLPPVSAPSPTKVPPKSDSPKIEQSKTDHSQAGPSDKQH